MQTNPAEDSSSPASSMEPEQINTILLLFLILRLTILFFYTPQGLINAFTDTHYYYNTALLSQDGYLPFVNMWYEYPPVLAYTVQGVFALTAQIVPIGDLQCISYILFAALLRIIVLVFDAGILALVYRITQMVWGIGRANWAGWVYTALSLPMFYAAFSHNAIAVFWLLLALYLLLRGQHTASALALGAGIATKLIPVFLLGPVAHLLWGQWRKMTQYGLLSVFVAATSYLPFLWMGSGAWVAASFQALFGVPSYATIWAIIDGNWGPGNYGPLSNRLDLSLAAHLPGNMAAIPGWLVLACFGAVYTWWFFRTDMRAKKDFVRFVLLSALILHLWSKGWSPQYSTLLLPLLLVSFPDRRGLKYILILTGLIVIEWPIAAAFDSRVLLAAAIAGRTLLFAWICYRIIQALPRNRKFERMPGIVQRHV